MPLLVLVTGPPGGGKTTLARALAPRLQLPLIAKDDIKESLSDSLEVTDLDWSRKLGAATWDVIFVLAERFLEAGASAIFESNFYPDVHRDRLLEMKRRLPFVPFEIHCTTDPETLARRNNLRERHPVHRWGSGLTPELAAEWSRSNSALELTEHIVRVDTSSSNPVDLDEIVAKIREATDGL